MTPPMRPFVRTLTALSALFVMCLLASPAAARGFTSPSGNIRCYLDIYSPNAYPDQDMICLIFDADWDLPPYYGDDDPTCDLDRTRAIILHPSGPPSEQWFCHGDVFWPAPLASISYGSEWSIFDFTCTMATDGVRCRNGQGNSIAVNRARRELN